MRIRNPLRKLTSTSEQDKDKKSAALLRIRDHFIRRNDEADSLNSSRENRKRKKKNVPKSGDKSRID